MKLQFPALLGLLILLGGCSDTGNPSDDLDLSGAWTMRALRSGNTCGLQNGVTETVAVVIEHSGSQIVIRPAVGTGAPYNGSLEGTRLSLSGTASAPNASGCVLTAAYTGNGNASQTRITGSVRVELTTDRATCGTSMTCRVDSELTLTR